MPITPTPKIWMNGELVDWDKAQVHVLTHTLHYGMGVFEGIRAYEPASPTTSCDSPTPPRSSGWSCRTRSTS
jgi:hypothetical protein